MSDTRAQRLLGAVVSVAGDLTLPDVLHRIVRSSCDLVDAHYGVLGVIGRDQTLSELIQVGVAPPELERIGRCGTSQRLLAMLVDAPGPLRLADLRAHASELGISTTHPHIRSFLGVPIRVEDRIFGNLYLADKLDGEDFSEQDEQVVLALASAAGIAIGNATLFEQARRREAWSQAAQQISAALLAGDDPTVVLRLIAERAMVASGAAVSVIARPRDADRSILAFDVVELTQTCADRQAESARLAALSVPVQGTAPGSAFASGLPVVVRHYGERLMATQTATDVRLPPLVKDLDSAAAVPLTVGDQTLGVLLVARFEDATPFTDSEVQLVRTFAGHAALALQFARAEEDRRRLAVFEDRDRIAHDLHDLVIQRLFAISLGLEGIGELISRADVAEKLTSFVQDLDRTIRDIRNSIFSLQEPAEEPTGLRSELLRTAQDAEQALGFEPRVGFDGPLDSAVPDAARTDLLATLREALSNAARHAYATAVSVDVSVDSTGRRLTLMVLDNGTGIPDQPSRGSGLTNLHDRAQRWGGRCSIEKVSTGGTRLQWTITLPTTRDPGRAEGQR